MMNRLIASLLFLIVLAPLAGPDALAQPEPEIFLVAHASVSETEVDNTTVRRIYLGKKNALGQSDQDHTCHPEGREPAQGFRQGDPEPLGIQFRELLEAGGLHRARYPAPGLRFGVGSAAVRVANSRRPRLCIPQDRLPRREGPGPGIRTIACSFNEK
jgi:hypothetical protein